MILKRYIATTIAEQTLLSTIVVVAIYLIFGFLEQVNDIGVGRYDLYATSLYVIMRLPFQLQITIPLIIMIGAMLGLGKLIHYQELIAAKSQGFSTLAIIATTLKVSFLMIIVIVVLSELFAFDLNRRAQDYRQTLLGQSPSGQSSTWLKTKGGHFLHIQSDKAQQKLTQFNIKNNELSSVLSSQQIYYSDPHIQVHQATQIQLVYDPNNKRYKSQTQHINHAILDVELPQSLIDDITHQPQDLTTWQLWQQIQYLSQAGIDEQTYLITFYGRTAQPLLLITMVLIGMFFTLRLHHGYNLAKQIFIGIVLSLVLNIIGRLSTQLILIFNYNALLSTFVPVMLLLLVATLLLIYRIRRI